MSWLERDPPLWENPAADELDRVMRTMLTALRVRLRSRRPRLAARPSVLILGFFFACAGSGQRGFPLYAKSGEPLPREQVALLNGDVQFIDGQNVSDLGRWFELLPGCHVVTTSPEWRARVESSASGIIPPNGQLTYAMNMNAGYRYEILRKTWQLRTSRFLIISAYEKDPEGTVAQEFVPATSETDLQGCQPSPAPTQPPEQTLEGDAGYD
jgi:hypothetical protein